MSLDGLHSEHSNGIQIYSRRIFRSISVNYDIHIDALVSIQPLPMGFRCDMNSWYFCGFFSTKRICKEAHFFLQREDESTILRYVCGQLSFRYSVFFHHHYLPHIPLSPWRNGWRLNSRGIRRSSSNVADAFDDCGSGFYTYSVHTTHFKLIRSVMSTAS